MLLIYNKFGKISIKNLSFLEYECKSKHFWKMILIEMANW